ncbi:ABC transporter substrate-binding protein [Hymenobacter rubripertinctus]|uniref:ABC transporter substrate-binding protein n=1 Tax=Hymenobacter rubripertinctus TaxID=2029981 RepID=UPI0016026E15|nr:ABC transporter substrate-binding protein [Hymenobacter rubripertinctus]
MLKASEADNDFVPWLAEAMPIVQWADDSLLLVSYRLRPEATWDNGSPVLARDVAFTLKVMNCPGLPTEMDQAMFGFIRDIRLDPTDARRFTLVCVGQSPDHVRSSGDFSILPEYVLDPEGQLRSIALPALRQTSRPVPAVVVAFARRYQALELNKHPERLPGCGPYRISDWQKGRYLTLARKTRWWADTLSSPPPVLQAFPDQLTYQIIPDAATATLALRRGEIDLYSLMPAAEFVRLQQSAADQQRLRFSATDSYEFLAASFDVRKSILRDALTRRALSQLFDVAALVQATQQGAAVPSVGLISPRVKAYYHDSLPLLRFDPTTAVSLLQQAGWQRRGAGPWTRPNAQGQPEQLRLDLSYRTGEPAYETAARQFSAAARAVGVAVNLRPTEQSVLSRQLRAGATDMSIRTFSGNPFSYDFTPLLHSRGIGASNNTGFSLPASDELIDRIATTDDPARKARLLRQFQLLLHQERPFTVLYFLRYRLAAAARLRVPVTGLKPGYEAARIRVEVPQL